jgi:hypothetical protein
LLDQLFSALRAANYGPKNAERHVEWCRQFILFHGKRHPRDLDATDVQRFLDHLAVEQKLAVAWQREAAGALAFLYRQVLGMERGLPEVGRRTVRRRRATRSCSTGSGMHCVFGITVCARNNVM